MLLGSVADALVVKYVTCDAYNVYLIFMLHMRFLTHFSLMMMANNNNIIMSREI